MTSIERRDPTSGLIRLGIVLSRAQQQRQSGLLRVEDEGRSHLVRLSMGRIVAVQFNREDAQDTESLDCSAWAPERLFATLRPKISFEEKQIQLTDCTAISADKVVLHGVVRRRDLFSPCPLSERIPVEILQLNKESLYRVIQFGLNESERAFVESLLIPTPVTMAIWKRGLLPNHAGALIIALNLLGCFPAWEPGDLPRMAAVTQLLRKMRARLGEHEILGVPENASRQEVDRAFRKLSFQLHPDRLSFIPEKEKLLAKQAFEALSAAHAQLKGSRRSPKVRSSRVSMSTEKQDEWTAHLSAAKEAAENGMRKQAAAFVFRALSLSPPPGVVQELKNILRVSA